VKFALYFDGGTERKLQVKDFEEKASASSMAVDFLTSLSVFSQAGAYSESARSPRTSAPRLR